MIFAMVSGGGGLREYPFDLAACAEIHFFRYVINIGTCRTAVCNTEYILIRITSLSPSPRGFSRIILFAIISVIYQSHLRLGTIRVVRDGTFKSEPGQMKRSNRKSERGIV